MGHLKRHIAPFLGALLLLGSPALHASFETPRQDCVQELHAILDLFANRWPTQNPGPNSVDNNPQSPIDDPDYHSHLRLRDSFDEDRDIIAYQKWKRAFPQYGLEEFHAFFSLLVEPSDARVNNLTLRELLRLKKKLVELGKTFGNLEAFYACFDLFRIERPLIADFVYKWGELSTLIERAIAKKPGEEVRSLLSAVDLPRLVSQEPGEILLDLVIGTGALADEANSMFLGRVGPDSLVTEIRGGPTARILQTRYATLDKIAQHLQFTPGQTLVDLGSGFGRVGIYYALRNLGLKIRGFELAPERVEFSNATKQRLGLDGIEFGVQDLEDPSFCPPPADYYFLFDPVKKSVRDKVIEDLKGLARTAPKPFTVIAISGWSKQILADFGAQTWLEPSGEIPIALYKLRLFRTRTVQD